MFKIFGKFLTIRTKVCCCVIWLEERSTYVEVCLTCSCLWKKFHQIPIHFHIRLQIRHKMLQVFLNSLGLPKLFLINIQLCVYRRICNYEESVANNNRKFFVLTVSSSSSDLFSSSWSGVLGLSSSSSLSTCDSSSEPWPLVLFWLDIVGSWFTTEEGNFPLTPPWFACEIHFTSYLWEIHFFRFWEIPEHLVVLDILWHLFSQLVFQLVCWLI